MSSILLYSHVISIGAALLAALGAFMQPGQRPAIVRFLPVIGIIFITGAALGVLTLITAGPQTIALFGAQAPALALRLDLVSVILLCLISFIGAIVLNFSGDYLDGESRQGAFLGWMSLTLAAVMTLVTAGHLVVLCTAWIATSLFLHKLLLFYPQRPGAQRAARKKFLVARTGDIALLGAAILLWTAAKTGTLADIAALARAGELSGQATAAAVLLAAAAILKSAQFPTHGWLTEVMEAPTPVSALLHAGVINAGGFLLIRFADVMLTAPGVLAALAMLGGLTALYGGLVMLTQTAVKTSLAWSTVAQMGFMIFQCGLALFPLALLHIIAHSLYKAHAFLGAGGAVERVTAIRKPGPVAVPGFAAVARAFVVALVIYGGACALFGVEDKSPQAMALGAILVFGVAYLLAQGFADKAPKALTRYTALYSKLATLSYFALQEGATKLMAGTLPATPAPGPLEWALIVIAIISFGFVAIAQATFPLWANHPAAAGLRVHLTNGLYINALFDRALGSWSSKHPPRNKTVTGAQ